jgi:hypothetical protein
MFFQCANQVIGFAIYFPLLFVQSTTVIIALASSGMAFDMLMRWAPFLQNSMDLVDSLQLFHRLSKTGSHLESLEAQ